CSRCRSGDRRAAGRRRRCRGGPGRPGHHLGAARTNTHTRVLLVDRCAPHEVGGLAREAFGGMFMVDTREQRFSRIRDSVDLALADWQRVAEFAEDDVWPRRWAQEYVARARDEVGG